MKKIATLVFFSLFAGGCGQHPTVSDVNHLHTSDSMYSDEDGCRTRLLNSLKKGNVYFGTSTTNDYRKNFAQAFGTCEGAVAEYEVHHAVPQEVLTLWPDIATDKQMHSPRNLRGIKKTKKESDRHRKVIHVAWNKYLKEFTDKEKKPSKAALFRFAKAIDDKHGKFFVPPIR